MEDTSTTRQCDLITDIIPQPVQNRRKLETRKLPTPRGVFKVLSDFEYPALREIVKQLSQRDITALRLTCQTLLNSMSPSYPSLVLSCAATYPIQTHDNLEKGSSPLWDWYFSKENADRVRCKSGSRWNGLLRKCKGYIDVEMGRSNFSHDENYLICRPCRNANILNTCGPKQCLGVVHQFDNCVSLGAMVPICRDCAQTSTYKAEEVPISIGEIIQKEVKGCRCAREYQEEVESRSMCIDCQLKYWKTEYRSSIIDGINELEWINYSHRDRPLYQSTYACGICKKMKVKANPDPSTGSPGRFRRTEINAIYFMCLRCHELQVPVAEDWIAETDRLQQD